MLYLKHVSPESPRDIQTHKPTPAVPDKTKTVGKNSLAIKPQRTATHRPGDSYLTIPGNTARPKGSTLRNRQVTAEKDLRDELREKAKSISPRVSKIVEVLCRSPLKEEVLKEIKNELNLLSDSKKASYSSFKLEEMLVHPFERIKKRIIGFPNENQSIFIHERSKFVAGLLINDKGQVDVELIDLIKEFLDKPPLKNDLLKIHNKILLRTLDTIKTDQNFSDLINGIEEPGKELNDWEPSKAVVESVVRSTLGLPEGIQLNSVHSKQAVLSAILSDLRQGQMRSCFGTSVAIMVHDQNPLQVAQELKEMIETGKFVKTAKGKERASHIPKIYIPSKYLKDKNIDKDLSIKKFLRISGIKKIVTMAGIKITDQEILQKMLDDTFNTTVDATANTSQAANVIKGFIHQLAMHKFGLKKSDYDNFVLYDEKMQKLRELWRDRDNALDEDERTRISEEINLKTKKLDNLLLEIPKESVFNSCSRFEQELEMNFLATRGENSLLRSWEYSVAVWGRTGNEGVINELNKLLVDKKTSLEILWHKIVFFVYILIGQELEGKRSDAANQIGILSILDQTLDKIEDPKGIFDKNAFKEAFARQFKKVLRKRLQARFEAGSFKLYDATKASKGDLSQPLETTPTAMSKTIFSIAQQAADEIYAHNKAAYNKEIFDQMLTQVQTTIESPKFAENLILAYTGNSKKSGLHKTKETLTDQFNQSFEGGYSERILHQYNENGFNQVPLNANPKFFIEQVIVHCKPIIGNTKYEMNDIVLPMSGSRHAFLLRPDMKMLKAATQHPRGTYAWIQETLIDRGNLFIVADLNWERNGKHLQLAIRKNPTTNALEFICVNEIGEEESLPAFDDNHKFGSSGFTLLLPKSDDLQF